MKRWLTLGRESYADVVPAPLSDIEIARMWRGLGSAAPIAHRRRQRPPVLLGLGAALLAAAIAFLAVLLFSPASDQAATAGGAEARLDEPRHQLELPDGSRVSFGPDATLRALSFVADDVELQLVRGMAEFALAPAPLAGTRRFVVAAAGFELIPRSRAPFTRFRAAVVGDDGDRRIEVTVYQGQVDVPQHGPDSTAPLTLTAGQSWSSDPIPP
jgi:ferric-dicitrate binding protein FerR (iron transport regulator)